MANVSVALTLNDIFLLTRADKNSLTGGHYNLLGFDPRFAPRFCQNESLLTIGRGVNNTLPYSCNMPGGACKTLSPASPLANASDVAIGQRFAASNIRSSRCLNRTGDVGRLLGTAFVVRDMVQIIDALNEDGLLRYYGQTHQATSNATMSY